MRVTCVQVKSGTYVTKQNNIAPKWGVGERDVASSGNLYADWEPRPRAWRTRTRACARPACSTPAARPSPVVTSEQHGLGRVAASRPLSLAPRPPHLSLRPVAGCPWRPPNVDSPGGALPPHTPRPDPPRPCPVSHSAASPSAPWPGRRMLWGGAVPGGPQTTPGSPPKRLCSCSSHPAESRAPTQARGAPAGWPRAAGPALGLGAWSLPSVRGTWAASTTCVPRRFGTVRVPSSSPVRIRGRTCLSVCLCQSQA